METGALILINDVELVSRLFIQGKVTGPGPGLNDLSNIERVAFDEFRTIAGPHGKGEIAFHPKRGPGLGHLSGLVKERRIGIAMDLLFSFCRSSLFKSVSPRPLNASLIAELIFAH